MLLCNKGDSMLKITGIVFLGLNLFLYIFLLFISSSDLEDEKYILKFYKMSCNLYENAKEKRNKIGLLFANLLITLCFILISKRKKEKEPIKLKK